MRLLYKYIIFFLINSTCLRPPFFHNSFIQQRYKQIENTNSFSAFIHISISHVICISTWAYPIHSISNVIFIVVFVVILRQPCSFAQFFRVRSQAHWDEQTTGTETNGTLIVSTASATTINKHERQMESRIKYENIEVHKMLNVANSVYHAERKHINCDNHYLLLLFLMYISYGIQSNSNASARRCAAYLILSGLSECLSVCMLDDWTHSTFVKKNLSISLFL